MKFYLSAASAEVEMAAEWIRRLEAKGHECTHNWTIDRMAKPGPDSQHSEAARLRLSSAEMTGIRNSKLFWLLLPEDDVHTAGAWVELGYVLGLGGDAIISGNRKRSIFTAQGLCFPTHEAAFAWIAGRG